MNKRSRQTATRLIRLLPLVVIGLHILTAHAAAADSSSTDWRSIYDTVMLWVNFLILAWVIYHFGRKPLANFLHGQKKEIADKLEKLQNHKQELEGQIQRYRQMIAESGERFEKIQARIKEEGQRKRQEIIDQANEQSRKMLEMEKKKAANRIMQARYRLMAELADSASEKAFQRLPGEITAQDQENMLEHYINQIHDYSQKAG